MNKTFMRQAIQLAMDNIKNGGGPFGAVIVTDGDVIATGVNRVTANNDPTAHAEVTAIRQACEKLGTFSLEGCDIYASCEPCPMCLGAIYWARLDHLYYGANKHDAAAAGFDDQFIYEEIELPYANRHLKTASLLEDEAQAPFTLWAQHEERVAY